MTNIRCKLAHSFLQEGVWSENQRSQSCTVLYASSYNSALKTRSVVSMARLLSMRYERAACTEYFRSVRLQPHIPVSVTMQLRGKRAEM